MNVMHSTMVHRKAVSMSWSSAARAVLTLLVVAGLAVDAYVHFDLASSYDAIKTSTLSQGDLFRAEAVAAIVVGVALLVRPRRYTAATRNASAYAEGIAAAAAAVLMLVPRRRS
jgi:hypothetical protein